MAVRLVRERGARYRASSRRRAGVAGSAETLRKWVRQAEVDAGEAAGVTTAEAEVHKLRPVQLEATIAILTEATRFSAGKYIATAE